MTRQDIDTESTHRYLTRLGMLAGSNEPTPEQREIALAESDEFTRIETNKMEANE